MRKRILLLNSRIKLEKVANATFFTSLKSFRFRIKIYRQFVAGGLERYGFLNFVSTNADLYFN
jgi:hypothetical protein